MRFDLPPNTKLVHEVTVPIRWGDMDAMGHVNNTLYFRFMEIARLEWIFKMGVSADVHAENSEGPVIVNAFCNFLRQLQYPGDVRVKLMVGPPGTSSFDSYHTLERTDQPGLIYAEGGARAVWTNYAQKKSVPMPDWFRKHLE
jgi:acyl-CoA thioester hydrolase